MTIYVAYILQTIDTQHAAKHETKTSNAIDITGDTQKDPLYTGHGATLMNLRAPIEETDSTFAWTAVLQAQQEAGQVARCRLVCR